MREKTNVIAGASRAKASVTVGNSLLEAGTRFRLSELGRQRSPKAAAKIGTILRRARNRRQYYILWDGNVTPVTIHGSFIEPLSGKEQILPRLAGTSIKGNSAGFSRAG